MCQKSLRYRVEKPLTLLFKFKFQISYLHSLKKMSDFLKRVPINYRITMWPGKVEDSHKSVVIRGRRTFKRKQYSQLEFWEFNKWFCGKGSRRGSQWGFAASRECFLGARHHLHPRKPPTEQTADFYFSFLFSLNFISQEYYCSEIPPPPQKKNSQHDKLKNNTLF